tara:strand:+ start:181 stop:471 length:291 start_codon:yes stop_codon:yes gene_type:complete
MTDSCSDTEEIEAIADMAGELIHTKMEMARKDTQMTHVMRIGTFHMELVPSSDINPDKIFNQILDKLMKKYAEKLLEISIHQVKQEADMDRGRHYG